MTGLLVQTFSDNICSVKSEPLQLVCIYSSLKSLDEIPKGQTYRGVGWTTPREDDSAHVDRHYHDDGAGHYRRLVSR